MSIRITGIRFAADGSRDHEHVREVRWCNRESGATGTAPTESVAEWIEFGHGSAFVGSGADAEPVEAFRSTDDRSCLRVRDAATTSDALLALPEF